METCVVFGGSSGIGEATAARLARGGRRVIVVGRDPAKLDAARARIGGDVTARAVDARDRAAVDAFMAEVGAFDHLVLSISGGRGAGAFATLDLGELRGGFEAKLFAQLSVVQASLGALRRGGSITLVSAASARAAMPGTLGLGAINAALESTVPTLAQELAPTRVNAVSPGVIRTPWWDRMPEAAREAAFAGAAAKLPVHRVGEADDVARAIELCVENAFMTGAVLDVDGGARFAR